MMSLQTILGGAAASVLVVGAAAQVATTTATTPRTTFAAPKPVLTVPAPPKVATPVAPAPVVSAPAPLPPLDLSTMWLWNWNGKWIGSEWGNHQGPLPWKFDHIKQPARADTLLTLDAAGSAQLQAGVNEAKRDGLWEADVSLPQLKDGLVVAPLWLYDPASRDEIDFELAGRKGLDVSLHAYVNGVHKQNTVRLFAGTDLSNRRMRFGIRVDQALGVIEMFVDGKRVHLWERAKLGFFVSKPVKPWMELWAADPNNAGFVYWVGRWPGLKPGETLTMRVHGYGYRTLGGQVVR